MDHDAQFLQVLAQQSEDKTHCQQGAESLLNSVSRSGYCESSQVSVVVSDPLNPIQY